MPVVEEPDREPPEGAIETALWCNRCMLPSACRWGIEVTGAGSRKGATTMTVVVCVDCGSRLDPNGNPVG